MKKIALAIGLICAVLSGGVYAVGKTLLPSESATGGRAVSAGAVSASTSAERGSNTVETLSYSKRIEVVSALNTIKIGQTMKAIFNENPTTGYVWHVQIEGTAKAISYKFEDIPQEAQPKVTLVGGSTQKVLVIKGEKKGHVKLTMTLKRPWEKQIQPIQTVEYLVEVKP